MPIGYWSLWGQPRSVTSGDLRWPWNSCDARSRVTASHLLTLITSTNPIQVNRTTPSCVYSRFRWNLAEGCSLCDVITSWPDLTWPNFFHQKLRKGRPISYRKFQHDTPNGLACSSEKLMGGGCINPPPPPLARVKEHLILCFDGAKIDLKPLIMLFSPNLFLLLSVMMCAKIGKNRRSDKGRPSKQEKFRGTIENNLIKYYDQIINSLL